MIAERQIIAPNREPSIFTFDQAARIHSPEREMQMIGVSSQYELERYRKVSAAAGEAIAFEEIQRNKRAFEREFLEDIPISEPHSYFHINGELYSEEIDHDLFRITSQTDPREREGQTLAGLNRFQEQVIKAQVGETLMWYSPAGPAGHTEPFSNIYYESGRLYLAVKDKDSQSTHIDIKINEAQFPIRELLSHYGNCALDNPTNPHISIEDFITSLYQFAQINDPRRIVYTSRRDSKNPAHHSLVKIINEITNQINLYRQLPDISTLTNPTQQTHRITQQNIQNMYLMAIQSHMDRNDGEARLYGCSTTSVITSNQEVGSSTGFAGISNRYSTLSRMMGLGEGISKNDDECITCPYCNNEKGNRKINGKYVCGNEDCESN